MGWFERHSGGRPAEEAQREIARQVRAAGVDRGVDALCGPYGCRRFLLRFGARGGAVRVSAVEAVPLAWGGGPPPAEGRDAALAVVERSLGVLHRNMAVRTPWERGALALVRDAHGRTSLTALFDDDADAASLDQLPAPGPPGHPLERPETRRLLADWEGPVQALHARTRAAPPVWDDWEVLDDTTLVFTEGEGPAGAEPARTRRLPCRTLATWEARGSRFTWQTGAPLFDDPLFAERPFPAPFDAATELCLLAGAMLGARTLFIQPVDDAGTVLIVAVLGG
jgi:hypothetical protein